MKMRFCARILQAMGFLPLLMFLTTPVAADGNDYVLGKLRTDLDDIQIAGGYKVYLMADVLPEPSTSGDVVSAWLSIELDPDLYSGFTQAGLIADSNAVSWFVYTERIGVTCLRGYAYWGTCNGHDCGCIGYPGDLVDTAEWHGVELIYHPDESAWYARIYDTDGNGYDVAKIWSSETRIYGASSTIEEGYYGADPYITARFYHWHPQYLTPYALYTDWPLSEALYGQYSYISVQPYSICPAHYGATTKMWDDPWAWFAGTGGQSCSEMLFYLPEKSYLPVILQ